MSEDDLSEGVKDHCVVMNLCLPEARCSVSCRDVDNQCYKTEPMCSVWFNQSLIKRTLDNRNIVLHQHSYPHGSYILDI